MSKIRLPKEFTQTATSSNSRVNAETARMELNSTTECPFCKETMRILSVNGHNASVCMKDRVCLPIT